MNTVLQYKIKYDKVIEKYVVCRLTNETGGDDTAGLGYQDLTDGKKRALFMD